MTQTELYNLVCDTYYGEGERKRSESQIIQRLKAKEVIDDSTTDFAVACNEGNPANGLSDDSVQALETPWIQG